MISYQIKKVLRAKFNTIKFNYSDFYFSYTRRTNNINTLYLYKYHYDAR